MMWLVYLYRSTHVTFGYIQRNTVDLFVDLFTIPPTTRGSGCRSYLLWVVLKSHLVIRGVVHLLFAKLEVCSSKSHLQEYVYSME